MCLPCTFHLGGCSSCEVLDTTHSTLIQVEDVQLISIPPTQKNFL